MPEDSADRITPVTRSPEEVIEALRSNRTDEVRGTRESEVLDFKHGWYRLHKTSEKIELAKDVAAMANRCGGSIIRGIKTRRLTVADEEVADTFDPIPAEHADVTRHRDVIQANVYPPPRGIQIEFIPSGTTEGRGYLVISVPQQPANALHFLKLAFDEDGKEFHAFRVPFRDGAQTGWLSVGEIHQWATLGRKAMEGGPSPLVGESGVGSDDPFIATLPQRGKAAWAQDSLTRVLEELQAFMSWSDNQLFALIAAPVTPFDFPPENFYSPSGLAGALAHPPTLRPAGFGLSYAEAPSHVGRRLVVSSARERALWAEETGLLVAATNPSSGFLTWASKGSEINPVVIVEYTYLFTKLLFGTLHPTMDDPWDVAVVIRGATEPGARLTLPSRFMPQIRMYDDHHPAPAPEMERWIKAAETPGRTAYLLVKAVYDFFGVPESEIRCAANGEISEQELTGIR